MSACVRCGKPADHSTETCCSSHEKVLCHACYRRTHFVEVCDCSMSACVAERAARAERIDIRSLWSQAAVGDALPPHDDPPCFWPGPYGLECGRAEKHTGQHVATAGGVVLAVWEDVTAPSLDGRLRRLELARRRG